MDDFSALLADCGAASRRELIALVGRHQFDNAVKSRRLEAVFPRAYAYPWDADLESVRRKAAVLSVGGQAALSHLTSLAVHGLPTPDDAPLHVTAYLPRHPRGVPGELVVHRSRLPLAAGMKDGVPVVGLDTALVNSWPLMEGALQRAGVIQAWREKLVVRGRLARNAERMSWVGEIRSLRELVTLLLAGCESELEIWGHLGVFAIPELADANRQRILRVGDKKYRLDMAYEKELLDVELDGREFHASPEHWERDTARDVAIAKLGWQTIRLSHRRLTNDVEGCRQDVLAVREARRRRVA